jgi:hypothetical protein
MPEIDERHDVRTERRLEPAIHFWHTTQSSVEQLERRRIPA